MCGRCPDITILFKMFNVGQSKCGLCFLSLVVSLFTKNEREK